MNMNSTRPDGVLGEEGRSVIFCFSKIVRQDRIFDSYTRP